ncbi:MAG: class I SAM-dependent methyltransferase [Candidatus Sumerlaeota bacterium]|nr:class I SAM-dependent methyltransferase [Candidatus Sumerlaeota bacterium]
MPSDSSPIDLHQLVRGFWLSRILFAGEELGVFESLDQGAKTPHEAAAALHLDERGIDILLHALTAMELLRKDKGSGRFSLNPAVADALLPGRPGSQASIIAHHRMMWDSWGALDQTIRSGKPKVRAAAGPDRKRIHAFIMGMAEVGLPSAEELTRRLDLSRIERMLDVGGGPGTYSIALARRKPSLRATILDLAPTLEVARENIARQGMAKQVDTREGDALAVDYGADFDLVLVSNLLHSFSADECRRIVRKSAAALAPGGLLVVNEFALNEDRISPAPAALFAVNMLANTEAGRTYTIGEIETWMAEAALQRIRHEDLLGRSTLFYGEK